MATLTFEGPELAQVMQEAANGTRTVLVKDHGIYLCAMTPQGKPRPVCYAKGYNPKANGDVYDKCQRAMGGDDCVEDLGLSTNAITVLQKDKAKITIRVSPTSLSVSVYGPPV